MATIAKLNVLLSLDDGAFQRKLEGTRKKLDSWGESFRSVGTKMTAGITTPLLASGTAFVMWAADLEQSVGATEVLWGDNADAMFAWAKAADKSMGMTENQALQNANRFNAMFKTLGHGQETVMDMSQGFTMLSADLSAMWGGSNTEAADALTSALRGNYEGLDKYNINLTEAMVSQEAMNVAMADGRTEITEADKVQARYNLIMEQSADAQGQFGRETDTTSGKLAITTARLKNAATAFGKLLLPYVNKAADYVAKFVDWLDSLNDTQRKWVLGIAAVAAAMGPLLIVIGMLLPGIGALVAVVGFLLSPIGLVVLAVAAVAAGLIYAYTHFEAFRNIVDSVASTIRDVAVGAFNMLVDAFNKLKDAFDAGGWSGMFATMGEMLLNGLSTLSDLAFQGIQWLADRFIEGAANLLAAGGTWLQGLWDGATSKWNEFTGWLGGLVADAITWIGDTTASLWQKGVDLFVGLGNGAQVQWENLRTWIANRGAMAVSAIGDLLTTFWQKGVDLFIGLGTGAMLQWENLKTWISNRGAMAVSAIGNLISTLWQKGVDLFIGLGNGAQEQWANLRTWIANRGAQAVVAIGNLLSTLRQKGVDLLNGLQTGAALGWSILSVWLGGMGGRVLAAVGNLASSLYNAGVSIMNGLWDGMKAQWENVKGWLSGLNPANFKGPERRDKKMLYEPGIWIMQGLQRGLSEGWGDVTRQLSGYVPTINGRVNTFSTPGFGNVGSDRFANAGVTVIPVALEHDAFNNLLAQIEAAPERAVDIIHKARSIAGGMQ